MIPGRSTPLSEAPVRFCPRCYGLVESFMDHYPKAEGMCSDCYTAALDELIAKYGRRVNVAMQVVFGCMLLAFVSLIVALLT